MNLSGPSTLGYPSGAKSLVRPAGRAVANRETQPLVKGAAAEEPSQRIRRIQPQARQHIDSSLRYSATAGLSGANLQGTLVDTYA